MVLQTGTVLDVWSACCYGGAVEVARWGDTLGLFLLEGTQGRVTRVETIGSKIS